MKFPNLPPSAVLTGAEVVPITQGGIDVRTTAQALADANESKATDIASAATTDIGAAEAAFVHVTGTTTITALGTVQAGARRIVVFDDALALTHNATSLVLPTGADITTVAGDVATFVSEGSGNWRCVDYTRADGTPLAGGGGGGGLTNWTEALNSSSPNATVPVVSLDGTNAATNVDVAIVPKGTGGFSLSVSDGTATGGNKRGARAVDLQRSRGAATNVASGNNSFVVGSSNTASANNAIAMGFACVASQSDSVAIGSSSAASGQEAVAVGYQASAAGQRAFATSESSASGQGSVAMAGGTSQAFGGVVIGSSSTSGSSSAWYCLATGASASARGIYGYRAHASGQHSLAGSAQYGRVVLRGSSSSSTTPITVTSNGAAAASTNQIKLENSSAIACNGRAVFRNTTTGDSKMVEFDCLIKRGANAAATSIVGTPNIYTVHEDAGASTWALTLAADTTNGALQVQMAGDASNVTRFVCVVETTEVM